MTIWGISCAFCTKTIAYLTNSNAAGAQTTSKFYFASLLFEKKSIFKCAIFFVAVLTKIRLKKVKFGKKFNQKFSTNLLNLTFFNHILPFFRKLRSIGSPPLASRVVGVADQWISSIPAWTLYCWTISSLSRLLSRMASFKLWSLMVP